jgi:hypothetical protein
MRIGSTAHRIAVLVVAIATLTALAGAAEATTAKPAHMSTAEYRALVLRSQALNEKFQVGPWHGVPAGMTLAAYRALMVRSQASNERYGLGGWNSRTAAPTTTVSSASFAWGAFGIGAVAMLGLVLLATGAIIASRHTREASRVRTS